MSRASKILLVLAILSAAIAGICFHQGEIQSGGMLLLFAVSLAVLVGLVKYIQWIHQ